MTYKANMTCKEFKIQYALGTIDEDSLCRIAMITKNKSILKILSNHEDFDVRSFVAENSRTSIKVLITLSKDNHPNIRHEVAMNPNTPMKVIEKLCIDENYWVSHDALIQLKSLRKHDS